MLINMPPYPNRACSDKLLVQSYSKHLSCKINQLPRNHLNSAPNAAWVFYVLVVVYLLGVNPALSTSYSLFGVRSTSPVGALNYYRKGMVKQESETRIAKLHLESPTSS